MTIEPCLCGADDCKRCFPFNRQACKVSDNDRAEALNAIIDEVLSTGRYPQLGRCEFDLAEFIADELETKRLAQYVVLALIGNKDAMTTCFDSVREMMRIRLKEYFDDTHMVEEMAQDIADDRGQI